MNNTPLSASETNICAPIRNIESESLRSHLKIDWYFLQYVVVYKRKEEIRWKETIFTLNARIWQTLIFPFPKIEDNSVLFADAKI